jgi:hypothetical protein
MSLQYTQQTGRKGSLNPNMNQLLLQRRLADGSKLRATHSSNLYKRVL